MSSTKVRLTKKSSKWQRKNLVAAHDKPPYIIPSMREIAALPKSRGKVASTFSGCGGSSLGYKMAGFEVVYANEFIPAAQDVYRRNHLTTLLDKRDIRLVQPSDVLARVHPGSLAILDGSPPCASFSIQGDREDAWGQERKYSGKVQRVDDLFFEYARLVQGIQPMTFVAENVAGLVRGTAIGMFKEILAALEACGYVVEARILQAHKLGVPQLRDRLIFIGVRNDIGLKPAFPSPLPYWYSTKDALPHVFMQAIRNDVYQDSALRPANTVLASAGRRNSSTLEGEPLHYVMEKDERGAAVKRRMTVPELQRISSFPADFKFTGSFAQQWERIGRAVPPIMMKHIADALWEGVLSKVE